MICEHDSFDCAIIDKANCGLIDYAVKRKKPCKDFDPWHTASRAYKSYMLEVEKETCFFNGGWIDRSGQNVQGDARECWSNQECEYGKKCKDYFECETRWRLNRK